MKKITAKTKINLIIGDPVEHSISPQIHNGVYKAMGIDDQFVFLAAHVKPEQLQQAIEGVRALHINAVTITVPHKSAVIELLDEIDTTAKEIGAVNSIVNKNRKLVGYNTDYIGILEPLKNVLVDNTKTVAVLGAGGAAHAAVFAAKQLGAKVTVLNRTLEHARELAEKFDCDFSSLDNLDKLKNADVIINTTSVGLESDTSPIDTSVLTNTHIVFDVVYKPYETKLLKEAKGKGATIIHGTEMLLYQGAPQFELFTGVKPDIDIMRKIMEENL